MSEGIGELSSCTAVSGSTKVTLDDALHRREAHQLRVQSWGADRVSRASVGDWHPVYDFLFEYYPYRPAKLNRWSPGCNVLIPHNLTFELDWPEFWVKTRAGMIIPAESFPTHRHNYLKWAHQYLIRTGDRAPFFGCFGLHEWAMVYRSDAVRHAHVPLRLPPDEINQIVESGDLRCSHYDAFRFFTPCAKPRNRVQLNRSVTIENDQPGCIHVTMDLYKFAYKVSPWCPAELVADTFLLAAQAREIDMRASPYDLSAYGFPAIRIEERRGREEYLSLQRDITTASIPLRLRLIELYGTLLAHTVCLP